MIVWLALGLGIANVAAWTLFVVGLRRLIYDYRKKYGPMITALFGPPPS